MHVSLHKSPAHLASDKAAAPDRTKARTILTQLVHSRTPHRVFFKMDPFVNIPKNRVFQVGGKRVGVGSDMIVMRGSAGGYYSLGSPTKELRAALGAAKRAE